MASNGHGAPTGAVASQISNNAGKVFIGGLAPATTSESLKGFFQAYGAVTDASVMTAIDRFTGVKRSRGFGFVIFEDPSSVDSVIHMDNLELDGKKIEIKRIDEERGTSKGKDGIEGKKIFVGGLPEDCTSENLKTYFTITDPDVVDARVMTEPATGRSRGFGYVTFSEAVYVDKAVQARDSHFINGKWVEVKACIPMEKTSKGGKGKGKGKGKYGDDGGYGKGYQGGYDPYGYGKGGYAAPPPPAYGEKLV